MRTPTGEYRVDFFNKYGERIRGAELQASAYKDAHFCAQAQLEQVETVHSYTVMRTLFNSLDD